MTPFSSDFRLLLGAIGISAIGSRITRTALPMAAILVFSATPMQLGWLSVLGVLPGALVAWWAGAWIDRRSRRAVMVATDWIRALLIASIPVAALFHALTLPQLYIVAALVCMATVLFEIADHALLPVLVPSGYLLSANSRRESIDAIAEIGGPPLGGVLVQWLTATMALALDAFSFVASALLLGRIRTREPMAAHDGPPATTHGTTAPSGLLAEAKQGAALVLSNRSLRLLFASTMAMTLFMSFMAPLYTLFALQTLGLDPGTLGVVIGAGGVGALAGAVMAPMANARFGGLASARIALVGGALAHVFIPLAPADPLQGTLCLVASQLVGDALLTVYLVTEVSLRQQSVPIAMLGRAAALWKMGASVLAPIGMLTGALIAEHTGVRSAMWCVVAGLLLASAPLLLRRGATTTRQTV